MDRILSIKFEEPSSSGNHSMDQTITGRVLGEGSLSPIYSQRGSSMRKAKKLNHGDEVL
jgi:hypothetical protein